MFYFVFRPATLIDLLGQSEEKVRKNAKVEKLAVTQEMFSWLLKCHLNIAPHAPVLLAVHFF